MVAELYEAEKISDVSVFQKANKIIVTKLEACKRLQDEIKTKYPNTKESLMKERLWYKYKKLSAFVSGGNDYVTDESMKDFGDLLDNPLEIKKEYFFKK